eukprot:962676-Amphidinium_carterae.1
MEKRAKRPSVTRSPLLCDSVRVLHAKRNIFIVMDYAGEMHLHAFTKVCWASSSFLKIGALEPRLAPRPQP